jgi:hypothetical protein
MQSNEFNALFDPNDTPETCPQYRQPTLPG